MTWRLAWRNLWRHRARTLIMTSSVAVAYGLMLLALGINDDAHARMLAEATEAAGGDVLVHGDGFWDTRASDLTIPDAAAVLAAIRQVPGVRAAVPRVLANGLVSSARGNGGVLLQGIDLEAEAPLRDPSEDLVAGTFLGPGVGRGEPIVLGAELVDDLEIELGDRVVLTATAPDGEVARALFHLGGVIRTGSREMDGLLAYTTIPAARDALRMEGGLTQIGVLTAEGEARATADAIGAALRDAGRSGLEILTWADAVPEMVGYIRLDDTLGYLYLGVIFSVVLFSITNTFLMAVMERVRELGLLNALGLPHPRIGRILLAESLLMTALALAVGFVLGFGGHLAIAHWGIDAAAWGVEDMELSGVDVADLTIYSVIRPAKWAVATAIVGLATVASALYPAWRATRLAPAEAMRFYE